MHRARGAGLTRPGFESLRHLLRLTGVAQIAPCLTSIDEDIRRLAVGALLALLVEQAGKEAAVEVRAVAVALQSMTVAGCVSGC